MIAAALVGVSCGCRAKANREAVASQSFVQAPDDLKQMWELALAAARTNDYATAQTLLFALMREQLTPEQRQAVNDESTALNDRLLKEVEKGDPAAKTALEELHLHPPNRPFVSRGRGE